MSIFEKYKAECITAGFEYLGRGNRSGYSMVKCMVCGAVDEYHQGNIRRGEVSCSNCNELRWKSECLANGLNYLGKPKDRNYSTCECQVCGRVDDYAQGAIRAGRVSCSNCQIAKYRSSAKDGWEFINHFHNGRQTYVNLKHECCDDLVQVHSCNFLKGKYSCPHCMHTHFNDPSYFYVIQVGDIIKLGISNRPDQRYSQYGLPGDSTITEHLRIHLETKRDALVLESYAKQLVKEFKIPTEISKLVFTKEGFSECYTIESLGLLLTI